MTASAVAAFAAAAPADEPAAPGRPADVFFRDPDKETGQRIQDLILQCSSDSVLSRRKARLALESLGFWAVAPLVDALRTQEPPVKCAAILTLDAICERNAARTDATHREVRDAAVRELREAVLREDANAYVGPFAALSLGRLRDVPATPVFRQALARTRELELLRAAVPLALAKLRDPSALALLREQLADGEASEAVTSARLLALGFFPEAALAQDAGRPAAALETAVLRGRRGERQAALLGFLVATSHTTHGKAFLLEILESEKAPSVAGVALIGLAAFKDADVTERLARTAASGAADDNVRELACDLLVPREDPTALPALLRLSQSQASARLRASALLGLGRLDAPEAREVILARLRDPNPLVRSSAAVAAARSRDGELRQKALAAIDGRLQAGETDSRTRELLVLARAVLAGERKDVAWPEVGPERLFSTMDQTPRQRLLRAVNLRAAWSLDLSKIASLQTENELAPHQLPSGVPGLDGAGASTSGTRSGDGVEIPGGGERSDGPGSGPIGASRSATWQELRDLWDELERRPYITAADLPLPPAAPTGLPQK